ncbi:hypothetical protein H5410_035841 [Solanum commersonii]|uniref:Uncharacterized protein n=1 Tax=Solanum commersonii TaxID=4109 RepID=A0A9J5Y2F2_SOLCO|nr:hypothetical protein H5410_035841 [Solanum commersonii]
MKIVYHVSTSNDCSIMQSYVKIISPLGEELSSIGDNSRNRDKLSFCIILQYLWHKTGMKKKEKDHRKMKQNKNFDVDNDGKKGKDYDSVEKTILDKE